MDLNRGPGYLAVLAASATWATSGIFIKLVLDGSAVSPVTLAFRRDLFTFLALFVSLLLYRPSLLAVNRRHLKWLAGLGCLGLGIMHLSWNFGVIMNGVAVSTVQQAVMPIIVALVAMAIWSEAFTARKALAIGMTLSGAVLVSGLVGAAQVSLLSAELLIGFAIPVSYAMFSLFGKPLAGVYHPLTIITYGFAFAALTLAPFRLLTGRPWSMDGSAIALMVGLVFLSTIFPFAVYTVALRWLQVGVAGILCMAEIPFAALYSFLFLGERLSLLQYGGALAVVAGVVLLNRGGARRSVLPFEAKSKNAGRGRP
jgi:drug/metabolite transporter (DMT)-like permease